MPSGGPVLEAGTGTPGLAGALSDAQTACTAQLPLPGQEVAAVVPTCCEVLDLQNPGPGDELVAHLEQALDDLVDLPRRGDPLPGDDAGSLLEIVRAQFTSRWLDVAARRARSLGLPSATIASAGHELNAALGWALRPGDPVLAHHRSGAMVLARARAAGDDRVVARRAALLLEPSARAAATRRRVDEAEWQFVPTGGTGAQHLPRAVGLAWALGRQGGLPVRLRRPLRWRDDSVVVVGVGDVSAAHGTAVGAVTTACWAARRGTPLPLLVVCEDNGLGLSMRSPDGWIEELYGNRPDLVYVRDEARDPLESLAVARHAVAVARDEQRPVFLHLPTVRIGGHSGMDVESSYREPYEIDADLARDPVIASMRAAVLSGVLSAGEVRALWDQARGRVIDGLFEAHPHGDPETGPVEELDAPTVQLPRLRAIEADEETRIISLDRVQRGNGTASDADLVLERACWVSPDFERQRVFQERLPETEDPLTLAQSLSRAMSDCAAAASHLVVLGADVARKGGSFGVTRGLLRRFGASRVVDLPPDEQAVLGLGAGAGLAGLLPIVEIAGPQALHQASGLLRGDVAGLATTSDGVFHNPLVVRVPALARPGASPVAPGEDHALGVLRDMDGVIVACASHPGDAPALVRSCVAMAEVQGAVAVLLEPMSLYHERDLYTQGDGGWLASYAGPASWREQHAAPGTAGVWGDGGDVTIVSFGTGVRLSLRVAGRLAKAGVAARVVDLRWLNPLPVDDVLREASATSRLLVVDEGRAGAGVSEGLVTALLEAGYTGRIARVTGLDTVGDGEGLGLGDQRAAALPGEGDIEAAARDLIG